MIKRYLLVVSAILLAGCQAQIDNARAEAELAAMKTAIEAYYLDNGRFPVGSNAEIVAALQGSSTNKIYFEFPPKMLNPSGETIDPWGTPYQFSTRSDEMVIMSHGKNKVMDSAPTTDDLVVSTNTKDRK